MHETTCTNSCWKNKELLISVEWCLPVHSQCTLHVFEWIWTKVTVISRWYARVWTYTLMHAEGEVAEKWSSFQQSPQLLHHEYVMPLERKKKSKLIPFLLKNTQNTEQHTLNLNTLHIRTVRDTYVHIHRHSSLLTGICVLSSRAPYVLYRMKHWTRNYKSASTSNPQPGDHYTPSGSERDTWSWSKYTEVNSNSLWFWCLPQLFYYCLFFIYSIIQKMANSF